MAITTDLATNIGKTRLEIGDNDSTAGQGVKPDGSNFSDEEIQYFLTLEGSVRLAAAKACEVLGRHWSKVADIQIGSRREAFAQIAKNWVERGAELRSQGGGGLRIRRLARPANVSLTEYSAE